MMDTDYEKVKINMLRYEKKYLSNSLDCENKAHAKYASQAKEVIVEIGVQFGGTTKLLLDNSSCLVYGIDPIVLDSTYPSELGDIEKINKLRDEYSRFIFIQDYSFNIVKTWEKLIDYLFIDGDHSYDAVKQDFNDWFPFVKQGGIISLHDSAYFRGFKGWPGPSKFTDEILYDKRLKYIATPQAMTIFKKL